jgi:hypothetical protein
MELLLVNGLLDYPLTSELGGIARKAQALARLYKKKGGGYK